MRASGLNEAEAARQRVDIDHFRRFRRSCSCRTRAGIDESPHIRVAGVAAEGSRHEGIECSHVLVDHASERRFLFRFDDQVQKKSDAPTICCNQFQPGADVFDTLVPVGGMVEVVRQQSDNRSTRLGK